MEHPTGCSFLYIIGMLVPRLAGRRVSAGAARPKCRCRAAKYRIFGLKSSKMRGTRYCGSWTKYDRILPYFGKNMKFGNKKVTNCNLWKPDFYQTYKILLSRGKACKQKTTRYWLARRHFCFTSNGICATSTKTSGLKSWLLSDLWYNRLRLREILTEKAE